MTHLIDNSEAYHTIRWILDNADMGFFIVTAPHQMQRKIADLYDAPRVAVYDYSRISGIYSYYDISVWVESHKDKDVFFILNMQNAFTNEKGIDEEIMLAFNMSRDLLAQKQKIWLFFMTKELEYYLSTFAHDIYAYVRLKAHFIAEEESSFEGQRILEFDERHNFRQIKEALTRYKELEESYMSLPQEGTPDEQLLSAAISLSNIATLYKDYAEYDNALRLLEKINETRERILGKGHPDTAATYNNIAGVYFRQGDYSKALEWYQKALAICEKSLGKEHTNTAANYNNIAFIYSHQGDYSKSLEWYQKALAICEKVLGKEHPDTATTYNNIALVYSRQGDYSKALEWYEKALVIREKVLGKEHPSTATTYNNIALVYNNQGDYAKSLEWYQKAKAIYERVLGKEHPSTAATYNNIAIVYDNQGDYSKALEWYQKALDTYERVLGKEHPDTAAIYNNIAIVYSRQEDYSKPALEVPRTK